MSYRRLDPRPLGAMPPGSNPFANPTYTFAQSVDPYAWRGNPPGTIFAPYGWGPGSSIGMPANYSHHIGYERVPVPGTYDTLRGIHALSGPGLGGLAAIAPILAVL
ncbi:MAG TPA: hypothetical protein VIY27_10430 [Myxococcota bacterium]